MRNFLLLLFLHHFKVVFVLLGKFLQVREGKSCFLLLDLEFVELVGEISQGPVLGVCLNPDAIVINVQLVEIVILLVVVQLLFYLEQAL